MSPVHVDDPEMAGQSTSSPFVGQVVGDYEVRELIGAGAMGSVYLGKHVRSEQEVAIKIVHRHLAHDPKLVKRFEDEASAVAKIGHRSIVKIYDYGETPDGRPYFVMERLRGRSLDKLLGERPVLDVPFALAVARETLAALEAAHRLDIIHRDMKPDNVFLLHEDPRRPVLKILDFGIAKLLGRYDPGAGLTETGIVFGTPQYMAPEQAMGALDLDARVDLYSVGVMLFQTLTGALPYKGGPGEQMAAHVYTPTPDARSVRPNLPASVAALVLRAMNKDRNERHASAREMMQAIESLRVLGPRDPTNPGNAARAPSGPPSPRRSSQPLSAGAIEKAVALEPAPTAILSRVTEPPPAAGEARRIAEPAAPRTRTRTWLVAAAVGAAAFALVLGVWLYAGTGTTRDSSPSAADRPKRAVSSDGDPPSVRSAARPTARDGSTGVTKPAPAGTPPPPTDEKAPTTAARPDTPASAAGIAPHPAGGDARPKIRPRASAPGAETGAATRPRTAAPKGASPRKGATGKADTVLRPDF